MNRWRMKSRNFCFQHTNVIMPTYALEMIVHRFISFCLEKIQSPLPPTTFQRLKIFCSGAEQSNLGDHSSTVGGSSLLAGASRLSHLSAFRQGQQSGPPIILCYVALAVINFHSLQASSQSRVSRRCSQVDDGGLFWGWKFRFTQVKLYHGGTHNFRRNWVQRSLNYRRKRRQG